MKSKTVVLMVVAVVCGLAAAMFTQKYLAAQDKKVVVLVASKDMRQYETIKEPDKVFEQKDMPVSDAPKDYVKDVNALKNRQLLKAIKVGQPLVEADLLEQGKGGLETFLTPGKRAISINVNAGTGVAGFAQAGSYVDVIHTIQKDRSKETKVVLQNILVRAADLIPVRPEDKPGFVPATVTLEVTPEEGMAIAKVKDEGVLSLMLRAQGDTEVKDYTDASASGLPAPPPPPPPAAEEPKKEDAKVEVKEEPKKDGDSKKVVEQPPPPPAQEKTDKIVTMIYNGAQVTQAVHTTKDGEISTVINKEGALAPVPTEMAPLIRAPRPGPSEPATLNQDPLTPREKALIRELTK